MAIYSGFSHEKLWFSIAMLVYQRVISISEVTPYLWSKRSISVRWKSHFFAGGVTSFIHWTLIFVALKSRMFTNWIVSMIIIIYVSNVSIWNLSFLPFLSVKIPVRPVTGLPSPSRFFAFFERQRSREIPSAAPKINPTPSRISGVSGWIWLFSWKAWHTDGTLW